MIDSRVMQPKIYASHKYLQSRFVKIKKTDSDHECLILFISTIFKTYDMIYILSNHWAVHPPSIVYDPPVISLADGLVKNKTSWARSSGFPARPEGTLSFNS